MRTLHYNIKNKVFSPRTNGITVTTTGGLLLGGIWVLAYFLGSQFINSQLVDLIYSTSASSVPPIPSVVKKPIVLSEINTVLNLFKWQGDQFKTGHVFWQNYVVKEDLKFAFKAYLPYLELVPSNTRLSVINYMYSPRPDGGNVLLLQEFSTRGVLNSYWFNLDTLPKFFWAEMWPAYSRLYPKSVTTFIMVWKHIISDGEV